MNTKTTTKSKNILFLINKFKTGGAERMFVREINELSRRGYNVYVATLMAETPGDSCLKDLEIAQNKRTRFSGHSFISWSLYRAILDYLKQNDIKVIYSTLEHANIVARITGLLSPVLHVCIRESNVASVKAIKFKLLDLILNMRTNVIIAISHAVRESLLKYQPVYKRKIVVIEVAVPIINKKLTKIQKGPEFIILSVGRLTQQKRHDVLIRAYARFREKLASPSRLVIIGGGGDCRSLETLVAELGLTAQVTFTGVIPHQAVLKWYEQSNVFALASDWEGSSNVIREAMSYCLPIVCTDIPVLREAVRTGENGYLISRGDIELFADALKKLATNSSLRDIFGENSYHRVSKDFNFDDHMQKILSYVVVADVIKNNN
ncbi:MAG: glycosyltransferase [Candidatus Paceibacterota bacterium]